MVKEVKEVKKVREEVLGIGEGALESIDGRFDGLEDVVDVRVNVKIVGLGVRNDPFCCVSSPVTVVGGVLEVAVLYSSFSLLFFTASFVLIDISVSLMLTIADMTFS